MSAYNLVTFVLIMNHNLLTAVLVGSQDQL